MTGSLNVSPTAGNVTLQVQYIPIGDQSPNLGPATFTGSISGKTLSVSAVASGVIQVGQLVQGSGVSNRTYITGGSGSSWTLSVSQSVASTTLTTTGYTAGATFSGTISGTTLTITTAVVGSIQVGQFLTAISGTTSGNQGVLNGTYLVAQLSPTTWTLNQTFAPPVSPAIAMKTFSIIPTLFELSFDSATLNSTFYNSSVRLNTGDRLLLYLNYNGSIANAHDITVQIDLF